MDEGKIAALDTRLVKAARHVHVLNALAWPAGSDEKFLSGWRKGKPALPDCTPVKKDLGENITELEAIAGQCREEDPVEKFLYETAQSYTHAARMLGVIGTPDFTHHSARLYGRPDQLYKLQGMTVLDAARFFLDLTDDLLGTGYIPAMNLNISASQFAAWMQPKVDDFFGTGTISVEQDPQLSAKAIAGASRIRVRSTAMFSKLDQEQLLNHEAFVHAATMLNGKRQVKLQSLALGAPRTTRTQEGIAVLSELFTNTMDIARLRRVALRVIAVQQALDGADFIDVFKSFLAAGQSEDESVRSTQRVFRGGAVKDGIVFTKDAVYLSGLFERAIRGAHLHAHCHPR